MTELSYYYKNNFTDNSIYYEVAGKKTHSKFEATMWANGNLDLIKFYYMDKIWESLDWTIEPKESIESMMTRRCVQLRSQHDWVCLWYSGGYDSETILNYFVKNKLRIDELLIYDRDYLDKDTLAYQEQITEAKFATDQAITIKNNFYPNLKITHVTWRKKDLLDYYKKHSKDWVYRPGAQSSFTKTDRAYLFNFNDQLKDIANQLGRVDIDGREKPRLWISNGQWYCTTLDMLNEYGINSPCNAFYSTSELPEIEVKQAWLMINWLESLPYSDSSELEIFLHKLQSHRAGANDYNKWNLALGRSPVLAPIAYQGGAGMKNWQSGDIQHTRESHALVNELQKNKNKIYESYAGNVEDFKRQYPSLFNSQNEIVPIWSKKYFVKKVEPGRLYRPETVL